MTVEKMDSLDRDIAIVVNKFILENHDTVVKIWDEFICHYCMYFNDETYELLESLYERIPTMWSEIASYGNLPTIYARKYEDSILPHQWRYILNECKTDEDFKWVAAHMDKLPHWLSKEDIGNHQQFKHLLPEYEFELC